MGGEVATLAAEMTPYVSAAVGAYGGAVLAKVRDEAADATVGLGRRLLQRVFGSRREGEPLPDPLAPWLPIRATLTRWQRCGWRSARHWPLIRSWRPRSGRCWPRPRRHPADSCGTGRLHRGSRPDGRQLPASRRVSRIARRVQRSGRPRARVRQDIAGRPGCLCRRARPDGHPPVCGRCRAGAAIGPLGQRLIR